MTFKTGDIVQLKTGGARMTVRCILGDGQYPDIEEPFRLSGNKQGDVVCQWHDAKKTQCAAAYHPDQLVNASSVGSVQVRRR
jgi:uncharacterized protein YodC (DUF2158 family)